jgi:hypothetical protein
MRRLKWIGALVVVGVLCFTGRPEAQATVTAQINNFWNLLKAGSTDTVSNITYAFTNAAIVANGYLSFGTARGISGYGIRDDNGIIEIKNSGGAWSAPAGGAASTATFLVQTANGTLPNAQVMGALGTGLVINTTTTGLQSIYAGATCTNQFVRILSASGAATCATVALATDVSGALPAADFPVLAGDMTTPGASLTVTLKTVNANVGSFGSTTAIPTFTVNGKGLITAAGSVTPQLTLTNTYFSSLSAANLTGLPTTSLTGALAAANFPALTGDVTNTVGNLATTVGKIGGVSVALGSAFTTVGAGGLTLTITGATGVTLPTTGTLVSTAVTSLPSLSTVGTIGTGVWQGTLISPTFGGTGINNAAKTITLGGNLVTSGAFNTTFTMTAGTTVTFPTTGTLITSTVSSLTSLTTVGTLTNVAGSGTIGTVASPFATVVIGTAATNNLSITPAAFAAGVVATADDPGITTVKLGLVKRGTIAFTSALIGSGACSVVSTTAVTGLAATSTVTAALNAALQTNWQKGVVFYVYPTLNTVNLQVCNPTAGGITPENATLNFTAIVP